MRHQRERTVRNDYFRIFMFKTPSRSVFIDPVPVKFMPKPCSQELNRLFWPCLFCCCISILYLSLIPIVITSQLRFSRPTNGWMWVFMSLKFLSYSLTPKPIGLDKFDYRTFSLSTQPFLLSIYNYFISIRTWNFSVL